ncbi:chemotaxis protein CheW [Halomicroarcula sp. F28]|uniref:chemotaxis protein CheW n=1 Tax=Haloarcula salinisoli TaxID=2487746 RepID=UPI001C73BF48|nr:chemotaxis protein CheW [Halomicroarcula salinisoli]MBX0284923.1 chemotaxis protein CheW [Halomicroarcula salinisoli]
MSDDRMDRAERIRNMREGNRGTDDQTDDTPNEDGEDAPSASNDDAGSVADEPSTGGTEDRDKSAGEPSTDDTGFSSLTSESGEESSTTASAASQAAEAVESQTGSTVGADSDDAVDASDAQAAAQRAAESAAQVMGGESAPESGADAGSETAGVANTDPAPDAEAGSEGPAVPAGATGASTIPGDISGVELPDQQLLEEAMATSSVESTEGGARAAMEGNATQSEDVVRVLEFSLGEEYYCLDIEYVEEIVKRNAVTRVPNTPDFVDGVVDLRGQITTILEPKEMMDIEGEGEQNLIIVFDPEQFEDQGAIGWVVDEVRQVVPVPESEINHPPVDAEYINGVVDRDEYDQFVIWVEPEDALAQATATEDE